MIKLKHSLSIGLLVCLSALSSQAMAWGAMAVNSVGGSFTELYASTPEEAEANALRGCEARGGPNCKVVVPPLHTGAIILVRGVGGWNSASNVDPEKAAGIAMTACKKTRRDCKLVVAHWVAGEFWMAKAEADKPAVGGFLQFGALTRADAEMGALEGCKKQLSSGGSCSLVSNFTASGPAIYAQAHDEAANFTAYASDKSGAKALQASALKMCQTAPGGSGSCKLLPIHENPAATSAPKSMSKYTRMVEAAATAEVGTAPAPRRVPAVENRTPDFNPVKARCINPATGLPMIATDGGCWGVDVGGNPFGMKN